MDEVNFPVEYHNEVDNVKQSESRPYALVVDRLHKLAEGHNDILSATVNFKQPAHGRETPHIYETTIVVYMESDNIAATEKDEQFELALDGALDAIERQVRERREKQRNY